jgi:hypothetical protein
MVSDEAQAGWDAANEALRLIYEGREADAIAHMNRMAQIFGMDVFMPTIGTAVYGGGKWDIPQQETQGLTQGAINEYLESLPHQQHGGYLLDGEAAIVGEGGPELFVSKQSGSIIPAGDTRRLLDGVRIGTNLGGMSSAAAVSQISSGVTSQVTGQLTAGIISQLVAGQTTQMQQVQHATSLSIETLRSELSDIKRELVELPFEFATAIGSELTQLGVG